MKHFVTNRKIKVALIFALVIFSMRSISNSKRITAWYTQSNLPGQCLFTTNVPIDCTTEIGSQLCTIVAGGVTKTIYQQPGCLQPFYLRQ